MTAMSRLLVYAKRIAAALDRLAPPAPRRARRAEFSIATDADFERGYDERNAESEDAHP
jgi:hypothetical protein